MQDASEILIEDQVEANVTTLEQRVTAFVTESAEQIVKAARDNPKATIAAGAAVVAGAIAAAAIPAIRKSRTKTAARKTATRKPAAKPAAKRTAARKTAPKTTASAAKA